MNELTSLQLEVLRKVAVDAAIKAGQYIQSQFDKNYSKDSKEGGDSLASQVVTEVDFNAQEIILRHLKNSILTYDFGLLTEEAEDDHSRVLKDFFWCIDPMDGTLPFTEHRTGYAVSIALVSKAGDPVVAAVYIPDLEDCYSSTKGKGVIHNNEPFIFERDPAEKTMHIYMDQSFKAEPNYQKIIEHFESQLELLNVNQLKINSSFGGVRNAIGVMASGRGCYFKFPKKRKGCGSIWDYAATRLFFEELSLHVSDAKGNRLHLNNQTTTFMNEGGILYSTDKQLTEFIIALGRKVTGMG